MSGFSADTSALAKFQNVHRIVFLGDSITYAGGYVADVEAYYVTRFPEQHFEFINVGLSSETVSGLSEPSEKNPRPDLHERLGRVLEKTKPDLVFVCYGMNDGIYSPPDEACLKAFQDGMKSVHEQIAAAGVKSIIHVTPPVFDPVGAKARISTNGSFGFSHPYEGYNKTLDQFSDWLVAQRKAGWQVADLHSGMGRWLGEQRQHNPDFNYTKDGVHPDANGHWVMAKQVLLYLGATEVEKDPSPASMVASNPHGEEILKLAREQEELLRDAWLNFCGFKRPGVKAGLPVPEAEAKAAELDNQMCELVGSGSAANTIKSKADLKRLLIPGMDTNQIIAAFGPPSFGEDGSNATWIYNISTPFPGEGEWEGSYVIGFSAVITNGHLMQWGYAYQSNQSNDAPMQDLKPSDHPKRGDATNLKLFIVSASSLLKGQFIDNEKFPKLGWISETPDLAISNLKDVTWSTNKDERWSVEVFLEGDEAVKLKFLTKANVGKKVLIVVGHELVLAPMIEEPLENGFLMTGSGQSQLEVVKDNLANLILEKK